MNISSDHIREKIAGAICRSLALTPEQIRDDSRLVEDLGMDSLDFLDIMFSLEKEFGVKIRDAEFDRVLRPDKSEKSAAALAKEFLTDEEIRQLSPIMPALKDAALTRQIERREFFSFITFETLMKMVERKLKP